MIPVLYGLKALLQKNKSTIKYSITCIKRPRKRSDKSSLLQQVVFKCRFYSDDFRRGVVSEQWSLQAVDCLIQVVSNPGLHQSVCFSTPLEQKRLLFMLFDVIWTAFVESIFLVRSARLSPNRPVAEMG